MALLTFSEVSPSWLVSVMLVSLASPLRMNIVAATANILAKVAHGLCDDLVSLMIAAAACPVLFAPAMNHRMWENPIAQENVAKLKQLSSARLLDLMKAAERRVKKKSA